MQNTIERQTVAPEHTAVVAFTCGFNEIAAHIGPVFGEVMAYLGPLGAIDGTARAFACYRPAGEQVHVEAGFTVHAPIAGQGRVQPGELPGGEAIVTIHEGPYNTVERAYAAMQEWLTANGETGSETMWEYYLTPPDATPPRTMIVWPLVRAAVAA